MKVLQSTPCTVRSTAVVVALLFSTFIFLDSYHWQLLTSISWSQVAQGTPFTRSDTDSQFSAASPASKINNAQSVGAPGFDFEDEYDEDDDDNEAEKLPDSTRPQNNLPRENDPKESPLNARRPMTDFSDSKNQGESHLNGSRLPDTEKSPVTSFPSNKNQGESHRNESKEGDTESSHGRFPSDNGLGESRVIGSKKPDLQTQDVEKSDTGFAATPVGLEEALGGKIGVAPTFGTGEAAELTKAENLTNVDVNPPQGVEPGPSTTAAALPQAQPVPDIVVAPPKGAPPPTGTKKPQYDELSSLEKVELDLWQARNALRRVVLAQANVTKASGVAAALASEQPDDSDLSGDVYRNMPVFRQ